jgi:LacI family transcriptional regulator
MVKKITIADVAQEAGVSMMTVSRVINHKDGVSQETAQRIWEIIDQLGYRPSGLARGLASSKTQTLGLVVPDIGNPFFSDIARGLENRAYASGYSVFLCNTNEDPQREQAVLKSLDEKRVDGLVLCSSRLTDADLAHNLARFPAVVLINRDLPDQLGRAVTVDDQAAAQEAVDHLVRSGHQAIGFLAGPQASASGAKRLLGYQAALQSGGIAAKPAWVQRCLPNAKVAQITAAQLLSDNPEITALFCYNDLMAVGALKAAASLSRTVPDDLAIVGFDDIPLAELVTPALTTCRVPRDQMGQLALDMLLCQMEDRAEECQDTLIQPELIIRQSAP